jgi:ATP-dependent Clp protease, protease subunit
MIDYYSEFEKYATNHMGISSMQFRAWEQVQNTIYNSPTVMGPMTTPATGSLTPYILEEREMRVTQMDIFSRLMRDRIIWLAGPVNDRMSTVVQAQLMFLENLDENADITLHIDSPGGSVKSGLSIVDVMNYIKPDIVTMNTGMAASMGSILLGAGTKGKRYTLKHSRVMLHQVSSGAHGDHRDIKISWQESDKYNTLLMEMLAEYADKSVEQITKDADRDFWMDGAESVEYGIVDDIVIKR